MSLSAIVELLNKWQKLKVTCNHNIEVKFCIICIHINTFYVSVLFKYFIWHSWLEWELNKDWIYSSPSCFVNFLGEFIPQMPVAAVHLWFIFSFITPLTVWGHYWRTYSPKWDEANNFWFSHKCFEFLTFLSKTHCCLPLLLSFLKWNNSLILLTKFRVQPL